MAEPRLLRIRWEDASGPLLRAEILELFRRVRDEQRLRAQVRPYEAGNVLRALSAKLPFATETDGEPDLRGLKMETADMLYCLNLSNVRLDYARLGHGGVQLCNLSFANLTGVEAEGIRLSGTFEFTVFRAANLTKAIISYQRLFGCDFLVANLQYTNFKSSNIRRCKFGQAQAQYANFQDAVIEDVDFRGADLSHSLWHNATLGMGVRFDEAILRGAQLDPPVRALALEHGALLD